MKTKKVTGRACSTPSGIAQGVGVSVGITLCGSVVLAKLIDCEIVAWERMGYGVMTILFLSSFLGSAVSSVKIKRQKLMVCAVSGGMYFLILLIITALFFGGIYEAVGVTALLIVGGSGSAAILMMKEGRGERKKVHYNLYR